MGEQPKPVEDEVERALSSMRAGFLSGSEQIATGIASLEEHLVSAPNEEREAVHAHITRLVAAHERIIAKVAHLPSSSWDTFKVMVGAVKAQQAVLDQVSHLVRQHVLPRQLENLTITPFPAAAPPPEAPPPEPNETFLPRHSSFAADDGIRAGNGFPDDDLPPNGGGFRGEPGFPSSDGYRAGPRASVPPSVQDRPDASRQPRARSAPRGRALTEAGMRTRGTPVDDDLDGPEPRSFLAVARERTAGFRGLAAMVIVGVILAMLPRDKLQDAGAKLFEFLTPGGPEVASEDRPPPKRVAAAAPRFVERLPSAAETAPASAPAAPEVSPPPSAIPPPAPRVTAASAEAAAPPAEVAEERFVPVVFTHKDQGTVKRALADLKQQYPSILIGREGQVQEMDLGKKGIWHRLVFLPAGPRPTAAKVCDQLAAVGYDRCLVKAY